MMLAAFVVASSECKGRFVPLNRGRPRLPKAYCCIAAKTCSAMRWVTFEPSRSFQPASFLHCLANEMIAAGVNPASFERRLNSVERSFLLWMSRVACHAFDCFSSPCRRIASSSVALYKRLPASMHPTNVRSSHGFTTKGMVSTKVGVADRFTRILLPWNSK